MPEIPVVCQRCGHTFGSGIGLGPGATAAMIGNKSQCPNCSGWAAIPDGIYEILDDVVALTRRPLDRDRLDYWRRDLLAAGGYASDSLHTTLESAVSSAPAELRPLAQKVAKSPNRTAPEKVNTLIAVVTLLLGVLNAGPSTTTNIDRSRDITAITNRGDVVIEQAEPGRRPNQLCHCGSGKKFRNCHGR